MAIGGGCKCGAVRFKLEADPIAVRTCWCRDCQYWGSGSGTVNVLTPTEALTVTGETTDFVSKANSGSTMHRRFCPTCGTPLFSLAEPRPHITIIRGGAFDDPEIARPGGTIWAASAPSWAHIDPDLPSIPGQPVPAPPPA